METKWKADFGPSLAILDCFQALTFFIGFILGKWFFCRKIRIIYVTLGAIDVLMTVCPRIKYHRSECLTFGLTLFKIMIWSVLQST